MAVAIGRAAASSTYRRAYGSIPMEDMQVNLAFDSSQVYRWIEEYTLGVCGLVDDFGNSKAHIVPNWMRRAEAVNTVWSRIHVVRAWWGIWGICALASK